MDSGAGEFSDGWKLLCWQIDYQTCVVGLVCRHENAGFAAVGCLSAVSSVAYKDETNEGNSFCVVSVN